MDKGAMGAEAGQTIGLQALAWLLAQPELTGDFLAATGAYAQDLAQMASQPLFLGAVLDFLLEDDQRVIDFCAQHNHPLTHPMRARLSLPGAQHLHWT